MTQSTKINVLDLGYVEFIESWGSEERIIEAARMSTDKGFQGWGTDDLPGDEKLLAYLYNNNHSTPFEMAGMIIEVKAPIFVFREWHRHRTQSYNEMSARYIKIPNEHYIPDAAIVHARANEISKNKQESGSGNVSLARVEAWLEMLKQANSLCQAVYDAGSEFGLPNEICRLSNNVNRYSKMRASANLRNWLGFLTLRMDRKAQWEICQYANAIGSLVEELYPRTWGLFKINWGK